MGSKMQGKYAGSCKVCGSDWSVGDEIYYQKDPKAICSDKECFEQQGGRYTPFKGQTTLYGSKPIVTRLPDVTISDEVKQITEYWDQFFVVAHHKVKDVYPDEDVHGDRFGQIRSKMIDQMVALTALVKE